jgi:hypothetical protein
MRGLRRSDDSDLSWGFHHGKSRFTGVFNPRVTPDRSNGCRVFQLRSDGPDRFLPRHSSMTPWSWKRSTVQIISWTLEIYDPKFLASHKDTENKGVRHFNTLPSPSNPTVGCVRRFPDGISSIVQHLSGIRYLIFQLSLTKSNGHE